MAEAITLRRREEEVSIRQSLEDVSIERGAEATGGGGDERGKWAQSGGRDQVREEVEEVAMGAGGG